jgi:hypothetical protein
VELRSAVAGAQDILGNRGGVPEGGIGGPLAGPEPKQAPASFTPVPGAGSEKRDSEASGGPFDDVINLNKPGAFTEGFKRFIAAKNSGGEHIQQSTASPSQDAEPELAPQAEMVLRLFRGTVVKGKG